MYIKTIYSIQNIYLSSGYFYKIRQSIIKINIIPYREFNRVDESRIKLPDISGGKNYPLRDLSDPKIQRKLPERTDACFHARKAFVWFLGTFSPE